jgi:uncharacterized protein (TIGR03086 family)
VTTKISDLLAAAAAPTTAVVGGIADDQLDLPTPCAEFTVRDLLNHLFHVVVNFQALAARKPADWAGTPDYLGADLGERFAGEVSGLIAAWSDPEALEGVSPGMGLPQTTVGQMVLLDLTVHGWDLARATGRPYTPDPGVVTELHELLAVMGPNARQAGLLAEPVPVPPGSDDWVTLLALTGRDPSGEPRHE